MCRKELCSRFWGSGGCSSKFVLSFTSVATRVSCVLGCKIRVNNHLEKVNKAAKEEDKANIRKQHR